jgi:hypothetical protein
LIRENEDEYSPNEFLVKFGKSIPITRMSDQKKILKQKIQQARKTLEDAQKTSEDARKIIEDAEKELETLDVGGENAPQEENEEQEEEEQDSKSSKKRKKRKKFPDYRSDDSSDQDYEVGNAIIWKKFIKNYKVNVEKTDEEESFEENDTTPEE